MGAGPRGMMSLVDAAARDRLVAVIWVTSSSSSSSSSSDSSSGGAGPQEKTLSPGVLGGVVAGVVVGVLLLILAVTFPHYWKERLVRRRRDRHPGGPYHLF